MWKAATSKTAYETHAATGQTTMKTDVSGATAYYFTRETHLGCSVFRADAGGQWS